MNLKVEIEISEAEESADECVSCRWWIPESDDDVDGGWGGCLRPEQLESLSKLVLHKAVSYCPGQLNEYVEFESDEIRPSLLTHESFGCRHYEQETI